MDSIRSSVTAVGAELLFPASLSSPMESKFWSRTAVPSSVYNIKSEGSYANSLPMTLVNSNNSTNSSSGSCLGSLMQVMDQSGKYNQPFTSTSDSMELLGMDQAAKCGFSTVTSTHRNQYSNKPLENILDDPSLGLNTPSSELDSVWRLYSWNPQTRQEEFKSELPAQNCKPAGVCRFSSEISDDSSLDGGLPASSTVSSTSDGLADHEDDVYVDGSSTSVELPSVSNFTLNSPRVLTRPTIALPSTCSEGSTLSTDQVRSCGLDSPLVELESRLVDQTLALGTDEEQKKPSAANLQLGNNGNIVLVQPQLQDAKQQNDGQQTPSSMELKWKHDPPALDVNEDWSTKRLKPSPPSSPTSPTALQVPFLVPNLNVMNVNPSTPPPSSSPHPPLSPAFLLRPATGPNVYQLPPQPPSVGSLGSPADLSKVPGPPGTSAKAPFMAPHQFLFGASFPSLVNIDIREIENSRPKRRNVKISKDPQSVAARHRRERISDRIRVLQRLVPGGTKMDTASMLDEAISYVKYLKLQVQTLESCGNAGFDPRMQFPAAYYMPVRPVQGDCSTVSQIAPGVAPDHGMYGPSLGQSAIKFPDVYREQFCH